MGQLQAENKSYTYSCPEEDVLARINDIFDACSPTEQQQFIKIVDELSTKGYSETLEQIYLVDFKEVPVSIDRFLTDPYYLGETNGNGSQIYPGWWGVYNDVFDNTRDIYEVILSGATRIGKTSTAVSMMAYMLYLLMCYRNPQKYFGLKEVSRATVAFANLTKDLAEGVAFREFNDTLKLSPWFNEHGTFTKSAARPIFIPEGNQVELVTASDAAHVLGMQLWCLSGNTQILTTDGIKYISECVNTYQNIIQYSDGRFIASDAKILETGKVTELIRIELEDGSVIEGTPDHRVMLSDGSYKALGDISSSDDLLTLNLSEMDKVDLLELRDNAMTPSAYDKKFVVYIHTSPKGKRYIGITSVPPDRRWGPGGYSYRGNAHFWNAICKYGWDNFTHEIVAQDLTVTEACTMEQELIAKYCTMDSKYGYNHTSGGNIYFFDDETKEKMSKHAWCKGLTKYTDPRLAKMSEVMSNRVISDEARRKLSQSRKAQYANGYAPRWINNGIIETSIQEGDNVPEGFVLGRLNKLDIYIYRGSESKKISSDDLDYYISQGWMKGRPKSVSSAIKKSIQKMHWEYNGMKFNTAEELAQYLNANGYPDIVDSTITSLSNKGFSHSKKYCSLDGKIVKVLHENKIN